MNDIHQAMPEGQGQGEVIVILLEGANRFRVASTVHKTGEAFM